MIISFRGLGNSIRGKILGHITCITVWWVVRQERNAIIFEEKCKMEGMLWDLIHFNSSFWASYTVPFRGIPLNVILLSWLFVCNSKEVDNV